MKRNKKRWLRRLILAALGFILGINAYLANARTLAGNQLPMPFGVGIAVVLSGSMEPALRINDVIIVRKSGDYQAGDIVVYQTAQTLVTHRILRVDGDTVITRGDANNTEDAPAAVSAIRGTVIGKIPAIGSLLHIFKSPVFIISAMIGIFLFSELSFRKEKEEDEKKLEEMKEEIRRLRAGQENDETDTTDEAGR